MPEKKTGRLKIKISFGCTSEGVSTPPSCWQPQERMARRHGPAGPAQRLYIRTQRVTGKRSFGMRAGDDRQSITHRARIATAAARHCSCNVCRMYVCARIYTVCADCVLAARIQNFRREASSGPSAHSVPRIRQPAFKGIIQIDSALFWSEVIYRDWLHA
jgi:hypothetical protein